MVRKNSKLPKKGGLRLSKYTWPLAVLLIIIILGALEWSGTINLLGGNKPTSGTIPSQTHGDSSQPTKDSKPPASEPTTPESPKQDPQPAPTTPSGKAPMTPYGNFISNHHPNLDGNPNPSSVTSACITTPGATCRIEFTNSDGVVKALKDQATNGNGETSWVWDIKEAGFTPGSWKIKAIATLNGQTASAEDVQSFEIGP